MSYRDHLALLERLPTATWVTRVEPFGPVWANAPGLEFWKAPSVEALRARDFSDASEATKTQIRGWQQAIAAGEFEGMRIDWTLYPRGVPEHITLWISAIQLEDDEPGFLMQCIPTERAADPRILRDAEALRHTSAAVALLSRTGEVLNRNPAAGETFGIHSRIEQWFDDPTLVPELLAVVEHGRNLTKLVRSQASGTEREYTLEARKTLDPVSGADVVLLHLLDETARLGAERDAREKAELVDELRRALATVDEQRERWQALVSSAPELIAILDREDRLVFTNRSIGRQGAPAAELVGQPVTALFAGAHHPALNEALTRVREQGEQAAFEARGHDDERVYSGRLAPIRTGPASGRLVLVARDVTDRRELERQLLQGQKMQAMGTFAGGIAHDFNNLLMMIYGLCELAELELDDDDPNRPTFAEIASVANRGTALTKQLLAFSRKHELAAELVELNDLVLNMSTMLTRLLGESIRLRLLLDPRKCWLQASANQLEQVVMNLTINARDAMPEGGELSLSTRAPTDDSENVTLEISDTGEGMSEALQARIFEPFFTTKAPDRGTGLGLAMVHGIVEQSGGTIEVHSELGRGTRFELRFPAAHG